MNIPHLQYPLIILVLSTLLIGCAGTSATPEAAATSVPSTAVPPTDVPPTVPLTATAVPPTETATATATAVPPTRTPIAKPTEPPTATATRTVVPKPTNTRIPKPTAQPATEAPATLPPVASGGVTSVLVKNTFPVSCVIAFWGPAEFKLDAAADGGVATRQIDPGVYGWRAFLGGAETGEAGNLEIAAGNACMLICDMDALAVRYGCQ